MLSKSEEVGGVSPPPALASDDDAAVLGTEAVPNAVVGRDVADL